MQNCRTMSFQKTHKITVGEAQFSFQVVEMRSIKMLNWGEEDEEKETFKLQKGVIWWSIVK